MKFAMHVGLSILFLSIDFNLHFLPLSYMLLHVVYRISLEPLFDEGSLPPTVYNVVKDQEYKGELKIGFSFTPEVCFFSTITS